LHEEPFVSPTAHVSDCELGPGVKVWHFCNLYGCKIGSGTQIGSYCEVRKGASVGAGCRLQSRVVVGEDCVVEDHVFIGPGVFLMNDASPSAKKAILGTWKLEPVVIRAHSVIGGGVLLMPGVTIGTRALVGAGSLVTRNVDDYAVVQGNPARQVGDLRDPRFAERWAELLDEADE
jgi:UDP-2-acetamido-3-amino-2,3-dideoxy-glucuronate N-acetyltransferase